VKQRGWLQVRGRDIVDEDGQIVVLRGVGLGGWMMMENFITGYPSSEMVMRAALRKALGEEAYESFFDTFLHDFFDDADAAYLASLGLNHVRLPFNYRHFEDDLNPGRFKPEGFALLDRAINLCAQHGLYTILDLHGLPGWQNQHWHSDNPTHWSSFWNHIEFQDRVVGLWEALAERYRDNPLVAGYNLINEPGDVAGKTIDPFYRRLEKAIRSIDGRHILFLEGNRYATDFDQLGDPLPNTVYAAHDYALPGFIDGGGYPGVTRGQYVDRRRVEEVFLNRTAYMRTREVPIWIGEFGPVYTGDAQNDAWRYQLLEDQLDLYALHGASWALWTYKDIGLQGLVTVPETTSYMKLIEPALKKKARLGADAWGGTDTHIRQIMAPVEELFQKEFPNFQPYPWGQQRWINQLVRHMLLAEPLVDDFVAQFAAVSPERAADLGSSFRFDKCQVRAPLADALKRWSGQATNQRQGGIA